MTPTRKKILALTLAIVLVLLGSAALLVRLVIDPAAFAPIVVSFVQRTTGLSLTITGGLGLTFFPWPGIEMRGASLSDLPGFPGEPFASVDTVDIKVRPLALLRGDLEVEGLRLSGLRVRLIRDKEGRENWKALPIAQVTIQKDQVVVVKTDGESASFRYLVDTAEVTGAGVTFEDRAAGTTFSLTDIDIQAKDIRPGRPFAARVSLSAASTRPELAAKMELSGSSLADPQAMRFAVSDATLRLEGRATDLPLAAFVLEGRGSLDFSADTSRLAGRGLSLSGTVSGGRFPANGLTARLDGLDFDLDSGAGTLSCPNFSLALPQTGFSATGSVQATHLHATPRGALSLTAPPFDLKPLLAGFGSPLPPLADKNALSKVGFTIKAASADTGQARLEAEVSLDGAPIRISAQSTTSGPLRMTASVAIKTLGLDGYLPQTGAAPGKPADPAPPSFPGQGEAIDLRLTAERLDVKKLSLTGLDATAALRQGTAEISRFRASLAGGGLSGSLRVDLAVPARTASLRLEGKNLAAGPLLMALVGRQPLTGTAAVTADLTAQTRNPSAILEALSGKAALSLAGGRILGLNLSPEILSSPMRLLTFGLGGGQEDATQGGGSGTQITSARLSVAIKNGRATTNDLTVLAPPHKITGQGTVNLPDNTLDMRLLAHVSGVADIPVAVTGSLDSPTVTPDLAAIPAEAVTGAAGAALKAVTNPGGAAKGIFDAINPFNLLPSGQ
ncbi:AsmA family protein [Desulfolutivibrio sp.]|uniref:AsmA family protein n=1 Tax=Desulfolutivibrio sp. TaxID=2773296 RepID=UPI002F960C9F